MNQETTVFDFLDVVDNVLLDDLGDRHGVCRQILLGLLEPVGTDRVERDLEAGRGVVVYTGLATERHRERTRLGLGLDDLDQGIGVHRNLEIRTSAGLRRKNLAGERLLAEPVTNPITREHRQLLFTVVGIELLSEHRVEGFIANFCHDGTPLLTLFTRSSGVN